MSAIEVTARAIGADHRAMLCRLQNNHGADLSHAAARRCIWEASDLMAEIYGGEYAAEALFRLGDHIVGKVIPTMAACPAPPPAPVPHPDFIPPETPTAPADPSPVEEPPRVINEADNAMRAAFDEFTQPVELLTLEEAREAAGFSFPATEGAIGYHVFKGDGSPSVTGEHGLKLYPRAGRVRQWIAQYHTVQAWAGFLAGVLATIAVTLLLGATR